MTDQAVSAEPSHRVDPSALRPVRGAAGRATAMLALSGLAWVVQAGWQLALALTGQPASGPPDQGGGRHRTLTSLENGYHLTSDAVAVLTLLCAAAFIGWLLRARDNARALSGERPRYAWPWVYVGWVLPIVQFWVPRSLVADVHLSVFPGAPLPRSVNWWWGLWLVGMFGGAGLMHTGTTDQVIARAYHDIVPLLVCDVAAVGAAVAAVRVVRAITSAQEGRLPATGPHASREA